MSKVDRLTESWAKVLERAALDPAFRKLALTNAAEAFSQVGHPPAAGLEIRFVESGAAEGRPGEILLTLPAAEKPAEVGPIAFNAEGPVMLAGAVNIGQTWVIAETSGFAVAQVVPISDTGRMSYAYGGIYTAGNWFRVQGGTVGSFGSGWSTWMGGNPNAICVPIQGGTTWGYRANNANGNQSDSVVQIWWFPMGSVSPGKQTYRMLTPSETAAFAPASPPMPDFSRVDTQRTAAADTFVAKLELAFAKSLDTSVRAELSDLLRQL